MQGAYLLHEGRRKRGKPKKKKKRLYVDRDRTVTDLLGFPPDLLRHSFTSLLPVLCSLFPVPCLLLPLLPLSVMKRNFFSEEKRKKKIVTESQPQSQFCPMLCYAMSCHAMPCRAQPIFDICPTNMWL
jgi:hypothetical protein